MPDTRGNVYFSLLKTLAYIAQAAMAGAIIYAVVMAIRYWPGIGV